MALKPKEKKKTVSKIVKKTKDIKYAVQKFEIDVSQILLHSRQLFLYKEINEENVERIIKGLLSLQELSPDPIVLWINSPGGSVNDGWALIDVIRTLKCPVITIISGTACSMAGIISLAGDKRFITENSVWMAHELTAGDYDYAQKMFDRVDFYKIVEKKLIKFLAEKTKLSQNELEKARRGELWLSAEECVEKGIVDGVIKSK